MSISRSLAHCRNYATGIFRPPGGVARLRPRRRARRLCGYQAGRPRARRVSMSARIPQPRSALPHWSPREEAESATRAPQIRPDRMYSPGIIVDAAFPPTDHTLDGMKLEPLQVESTIPRSTLGVCQLIIRHDYAPGHNASGWCSLLIDLSTPGCCGAAGSWRGAGLDEDPRQVVPDHPPFG